MDLLIVFHLLLHYDPRFWCLFIVHWLRKTEMLHYWLVYTLCSKTVKSISIASATEGVHIDPISGRDIQKIQIQVGLHSWCHVTVTSYTVLQEDLNAKMNPKTIELESNNDITKSLLFIVPAKVFATLVWVLSLETQDFWVLCENCILHANVVYFTLLVVGFDHCVQNQTKFNVNTFMTFLFLQHFQQ